MKQTQLGCGFLTASYIQIDMLKAPLNKQMAFKEILL